MVLGCQYNLLETVKLFEKLSSDLNYSARGSSSFSVEKYPNLYNFQCSFV